EEINSNSTALSDFPPNSQIAVFPNPTDGKLKLSADILQYYEQYYLMDIQGKLIEQDSLKSDNLDLTHLDAGLYLLGFIEQGIKSKPIKIRVQ
ncbi:MAG: T9SS type A sorting domain-containing protein, partial [Bacteroidota bacterium]